MKTTCNMYLKLTKNFIKNYLLSYISSSNLGRNPKFEKWRILKAIIHRLKTGCQWRELPTAAFFNRPIHWNTVYYYFNKWAKKRIFKYIWLKILSFKKAELDLSSVQLDGSHTPAKRGGQAVGYQGRKKAKTTNALFLTDKDGIPLAMSPVVAGNHNDLFEINSQFGRMISDLRKAKIPIDGLFMNADAGFDSSGFRKFCIKNGIIPNFDHNKRNSKTNDYQHVLDELLYKERFSVERTNAWLDAFKMILVRFETRTDTWEALHYLAFTLILLRAKTNHF